jgi:pimeloyl-ACP methyl ester carboxylesterase
MNAEQMILDTEYVVRYLLEQFAKKKLFVLGHSWGSYLGLELARRHPGWLHAYVGTGQMIDSTRSEAEGYEFALQQARRHGNDGAVRELTRIAPYPGPIGALTVDRISIQRKWVIFYGGLTYGRSNFAYDAAAWRFAPEYTDRDVQLVDDGSLFSLEHLLGVVERTNFDAVTSIKCPLFLFQGRHDYETSYSVASQWFERVEAPQKGRVTFLNSSHMGMLEQPGEYLQHLVKVVRPLAVTVGDSAPSGVECSPCT